jgi:dTMP kinase
MSQGTFIAIEGGDGSGKATQTALLVEYLNDVLKMSAMKVSFPRYGESSAYYVERYLNGAYGSVNEVSGELASLAYAIDRFALKDTIMSHLEQSGSFVVADRYVASNLAHQGAKIADDEERAKFYNQTMITEYDILKIPRPSKNIVLLTSVKLSQENVDKKDASIRQYTDKKRDIHEADSSHLEKAKANYEELCRLYPNEFIAINCAGDDGKMRSVQDIQLDIRSVLNI